MHTPLALRLRHSIPSLAMSASSASSLLVTDAKLHEFTLRGVVTSDQRATQCNLLSALTSPSQATPALSPRVVGAFFGSCSLHTASDSILSNKRVWNAWVDYCELVAQQPQVDDGQSVLLQELIGSMEKSIRGWLSESAAALDKLLCAEPDPGAPFTTDVTMILTDRTDLASSFRRLVACCGEAPTVLVCTAVSTFIGAVLQALLAPSKRWLTHIKSNAGMIGTTESAQRTIAEQVGHITRTFEQYIELLQRYVPVQSQPVCPSAVLAALFEVVELNSRVEGTYE